MIATILYSSPTFEAVDYNSRKVAKGDATLLCVENFGYLDDTKECRPAYLRQYLIDYSKRNERIEKSQMHVAFSCKGQEMNNEELVSFARQWLAEMGYDDPKQPLLIYSHEDTDNNHIHVITSRVDPRGKKIEHSHERVRSKAFVERMLGVQTKEELDKAIANSFNYKFESLAQWKAVLEASGYDVKEEGDCLKIERNGAYQSEVPKSEVRNKIVDGYVEKKRLRQLRAQLRKYRDLSCSKEELQELMKSKFGVDLVFFGGKDNPRGYFIVDHKNRQVYKGSAVLKIGELLTFESPENKMKRIDAFVDAQLEDNPRLTGKELHKLLKKHYSAWYKDGIVHLGTRKFELKDYMKEALKYNTRIEHIASFGYNTQEEKDVLCKFFKIESSELQEKNERTARQTGRILEAAKYIADNNLGMTAVRKHFADRNMLLIKATGKHFVLDMQVQTVCCLEDNGISLRISSIPAMEERRNTSKVPVSSAKTKNDRWKSDGNNGSGANREFEVGTSGHYDDIDDARTLKR